MPDFHLSEQEINDLIDFLEFTAGVKTQGWPPKTSG
jgi:nitric oxide reductase subunit C